MRKLAVNICATTGISLVLLAVIGLLSGGTYLYLVGVFQVLVTNMMIHVGMLLVSRMALQYPLLEALFDVALILVMVCGSGLAFGWFSSTPLWILCILGIVMYGASTALNVLHMRREVQEINMLIGRRKLT